MKKKRTLNQTWVLCLRMWRWISKMKAEKSRKWVTTLKTQWLREAGIKIKGDSDCFFCEYIIKMDSCHTCPGRLVDPSFSCHREAYHYQREPIAFYKKLLHLNRIRKAKK